MISKEEADRRIVDPFYLKNYPMMLELLQTIQHLYEVQEQSLIMEKAYQDKIEALEARVEEV